jgi:hypothetical protein
MLWVKSGWWGSDGRTAGVEIRLEELGKQWVSGETLRAGVWGGCCLLPLGDLCPPAGSDLGIEGSPTSAFNKAFVSIVCAKVDIFFMLLYRRRHYG